MSERTDYMLELLHAAVLACDRCEYAHNVDRSQLIAALITASATREAAELLAGGMAMQLEEAQNLSANVWQVATRR